jgi:hypothetical protein
MDLGGMNSSSMVVEGYERLKRLWFAITLSAFV